VFPGIWRHAGRSTAPLAHFDSSPGRVACIICAHGVDVRQSCHRDERETIPKALRGLHLRWAGEADFVCLLFLHRTLGCQRSARDIPFPELNLAIRGVPDSPWQRVTRAAAGSETIFDMRERKELPVGKPPVVRKLSGPVLALISISYQQGAGLIERLVPSLCAQTGNDWYTSLRI